MKIYSGNILTLDKCNSVKKYLVEDKGRIIYVGDELPEKYAKEDIIKLNNKSLIPSFVDTHQHFASFSIFNAGLNVMEVSSNKEMLSLIKEFASNSKEKTLIAFGASPYSVKEGKLISKKELDSVCEKKELMLVKYDGHACIINSKLLDKIRKKVCNLRGFHEETGEMNQEAFFAVSDYITKSISIKKLIKNMQKAVDFEAEKGIGMVHTVSGVGFPMNLDIRLEKIFAKSVQNGFKLRVFPQTLDTRFAKKMKLPRIGGCFKCALDGCFGSQDAAMNEAYFNDSNNYGVLYYSDEQVADFCKKANRLGLQIEMHAIGDKAFDQACRCLKIALDDYPRENHRHGIIHACLPTEYGLKICKEYNIQLPMQIAFDDWKQEPPAYTKELLGEDRNGKLNPIKDFLNLGCFVSFGSDAPCTEPNPILWLHKAVNHSNPKQSVTIQEALKMATYNGCYASFDEKEYGSLEMGKVADMLILSDNPYTIDKENIRNIKVEKTILDGKEYKKQNKTFLGIILSGIFSRNKY